MTDAPIVHEFQIRENDPWYGDFVTTEENSWFVHAHEFKAYREWAEKWKRVAERAGVCMTCALGALDISIGCTDCLNTGFENGAPNGFIREDHVAAELEVAKAGSDAWSNEAKSTYQRVLSVLAEPVEPLNLTKRGIPIDRRDGVARALYEHDNPEPRVIWPPHTKPALVAKYIFRAEAAILALAEMEARYG